MNFNKYFYVRLVLYSICIFLFLVFSSCGGGDEKTMECPSSKQSTKAVKEEAEQASPSELPTEVGTEEISPPCSSSTQPPEVVKEKADQAITSKLPTDVSTEDSAFLSRKIENDLVEEYKKELSSANIAFNTPQKMEKNETTIVKLLLSHYLPLKDLRKKVEDTIGRKYLDSQKQKITGERIKVDTLIEIDLSGSEGFMIRRIGKHDQRAISKTNIEEWKWEVKAVEVGIQYLFIDISAIIRLKDKDRYLQLITFNREIEVYISASSAITDFFSKYWKWFLTVMVIPLTLAARQRVVNWVKKRKKEKNRNPLIKIPSGL